MSTFRADDAAQRYELDHPGGPSIATYAERDGGRIILYVETPYEARGQGHADKLMAEITAHARANGLKLGARCPFAVAYFRRHRDTQDVATL
jgi:predicted GNAT family acetyltransferase